MQTMGRWLNRPSAQWGSKGLEAVTEWFLVRVQVQEQKRTYRLHNEIVMFASSGVSLDTRR